MDVIPRSLILDMLGADFDYCHLPTIDFCGGILLAWRSSCWSVVNISYRHFSLTASHSV
uniref:Uncharacterized protein n=1 Tax=Arundo donax TaxID=35708 RepID=A0A0A9FRC2_ARUDO